MLAVFLPVISGFVFRHVVLSGLGSVLLAANLPPDAASKVVDLVQTLGPVGGTVLGLVLMGGALGWSFVQKKKSGALDQ